MFGDHHVGKVLEEISLIRRALEGVHDELKRANEHWSCANEVLSSEASDG